MVYPPAPGRRHPLLWRVQNALEPAAAACINDDRHQVNVWCGHPQPRRQRSAGSGPKKKLGRPLSGRQTVIPQFNYAFYVWSSYGLFAAVMAWQLFQPLVQRRNIMAGLREQEAGKSGGADDDGDEQ